VRAGLADAGSGGRPPPSGRHQRATALAWDAASGAPLGPALGWQDQRTGPRVCELNAQGIAVTTLPSATKFEWLLRREPGVAAAARAGRLRLGTPDAWLTDRLTGGAAFARREPASCTGLFDLRRGGRALDLAGIDAWLRAGRDQRDHGRRRAVVGASVPVAARGR
jgi:glycerol kinase